MGLKKLLNSQIIFWKESTWQTRSIKESARYDESTPNSLLWGTNMPCRDQIIKDM